VAREKFIAEGGDGADLSRLASASSADSTPFVYTNTGQALTGPQGDAFGGLSGLAAFGNTPIGKAVLTVAGAIVGDPSLSGQVSQANASLQAVGIGTPDPIVTVKGVPSHIGGEDTFPLTSPPPPRVVFGQARGKLSTRAKVAAIKAALRSPRKIRKAAYAALYRKYTSHLQEN
jgi:hypothetical protein